MIIKLQKLQGKTKLKVYQKRRNYYDEMNYRRQSGNFQFEEDLFSRNFQGTSKIYQEI